MLSSQYHPDFFDRRIVGDETRRRWMFLVEFFRFAASAYVRLLVRLVLGAGRSLYAVKFTSRGIDDRRLFHRRIADKEDPKPWRSQPIAITQDLQGKPVV